MVEQAFHDYYVLTSDEQKRGVVEMVIRELSKHAALEELMVYPLAKQVLPAEARDIDEHLAEHLSVKKTLAALDELSAGDQKTDGLMSELQREIEHHVQEEEGEMMPKLRDAVDQQALDELGEALGRAKETAPTRPHPHAPDEPPGLALAGPVATIYDRLRDRLHGRPKT